MSSRVVQAIQMDQYPVFGSEIPPFAGYRYITHSRCEIVKNVSLKFNIAETKVCFIAAFLSDRINQKYCDAILNSSLCEYKYYLAFG